MDSLNQIEIQNIRHICGAIATCKDKLDYYKTITNDSNITNIFDEIYSNSTTLKNDLCGLL